MKRTGILALLIGSSMALSACAGLQIPAANGPAAAEETPAAETAAAEEAVPAAEAGRITNKLFSFVMPEELAGTYNVEISAEDDSVWLIDRASAEADFGGRAFGIYYAKDPGQYGMMPGGVKAGELTAADGTVYDILFARPTDVQYDYSQGEEPEAYRKLYEAGDTVIQNLEALDGGTYVYGGGTKGEDLYADELAKHVQAIEEGWDSAKLEEEDMSVMYNLMKMGGDDVLERTGYAYYDVNGDGIEELLIGEIAEGDWKGIIYDMYTMVDRSPAHVFSGWDRNRYFALPYLICNEASAGAGESYWNIYDLPVNQAELFPQLSFKTDEYENPDQPWFVSYGGEEEWENLTEEEWNLRMDNFRDYVRFDYTPLSTLK